jgi:hypothetical protein
LANYPRHKEAYLAWRKQGPLGKKAKSSRRDLMRARVAEEVEAEAKGGRFKTDSFGRCQSDLCQVVSGIGTSHTDYGMLWHINESRLFSFTRCLQIGSGG